MASMPATFSTGRLPSVSASTRNRTAPEERSQKAKLCGWMEQRERGAATDVFFLRIRIDLTVFSPCRGGRLSLIEGRFIVWGVDRLDRLRKVSLIPPFRARRGIPLRSNHRERGISRLARNDDILSF